MRESKSKEVLKGVHVEVCYLTMDLATRMRAALYNYCENEKIGLKFL